MSIIDAAALDAARGKPGLAATIERFRFMNEMLEWHAHGEDSVIGPLLESVAPSVYSAYELDHRGLDAAFTALKNAVSLRDPLETTRATKAFRFHLDLHLDKEDRHMYRLIKERVSIFDQAMAVGKMGTSVPRDRFPEVVAWMFPLMDNDDRVLMTLNWKKGMPAPAFAGALQLIKQAVGDDWAELAPRSPRDAQEMASA
jgi:hypothetical protein